MSGELSEETKALSCLLEKHSELLSARYRIAPADEHWLVLIRYIIQLHRIAIRLPSDNITSSGAYGLREAIKLLIASHWRLIRTSEEEPPPYLVVAIDAIERRSASWFSYEREMWMEE